ncbi:hypothetical protein [Phenylobacterium sp. SCN 70-31]|uniref:hypothetical protein n=1 Tax=Phenylobacterium sp. SCN 70-31 TaxID=1660129 RepID=UPI000A629BE9|nr:hypothetical protein [Phenylobacterium sp. SCN 70-31]
MDRPQRPTPDGFRLALRPTGEVWSWRLTTPAGVEVGAHAPDLDAARASAAFAASVMKALDRSRRRGV